MRLQFFIIFIKQRLNIIFIESNIELINKINTKIEIEIEILKYIYFFAFNTSLLLKELLLNLIILYRYLI